jgi:hypothetical protein
MDSFPALRTEVDRITIDHIRTQEEKCREHVQYQINFELAYINTNHEVGQIILPNNCITY